MTEKRYVVKDKWIKDSCIGRLLNIDFNTITDANLCCDLLNQIEKEKRDNGKLASKLLEENEQLKQRNNRQAKQLDRLYHLIEEKDWRTLTDILDDFKRCEEQLQKEWGTYGDVE